MIDDDNDTNFLVNVLLNKISFVDEYHIINNAKDAISFLESYDKPLNCIFVDVKMPEMDGFQFVKIYEQKIRPLYPETRIYFLTSSARWRDKQKAMQFNSVEDVIIKPLSKKILEDINQNVLDHPPMQNED